VALTGCSIRLGPITGGLTYMETRIEALGHHLQAVLEPSIRRQGFLLESDPEDGGEGQSEDDERSSKTESVARVAIHQGKDE